MELDRNFTERVRRIFRDEVDLLAVILRAHLILERCLEIRLRRMFPRPEILDGGRFGQLGFAQKAAAFVRLTGPSDLCQDLLQRFNKVRNCAAHVEDAHLERVVNQNFSAIVPEEAPEEFGPDATVKWALMLALQELELEEVLKEEGEDPSAR